MTDLWEGAQQKQKQKQEQEQKQKQKQEQKQVLRLPSLRYGRSGLQLGGKTQDDSSVGELRMTARWENSG